MHTIYWNWTSLNLFDCCSSTKEYDAITCYWTDVAFNDAISDFHSGISPCSEIESEQVWTC